MKVQSMAHIFNEDVRCVPGDVVDLKDEIAMIYLQRGLVKPYREAKNGYEVAAMAGAAETGTRPRPRARTRQSE